MRNRIFIAADDLTGALDTGVQFAKAGLRVRVCPSPAFGCAQEDVLVVCTQSRHLPAHEARQIVQTVFAQAQESGLYGVYFKKLDSTLRGCIGSELEGMAAALGCSLIRLCNAFPAAGRVTVDGRQYVNGAPLHETPFANDPFNPIHTSSIREIIRAQSETAAQLTRVYDAQTDAELDAVVQDSPRVLAGCAGLAGALARRVQKAASAAMPVFHHPPLILLGSVNPIADEQAAFACEHGARLRTLPQAFSLAELPLILRTPRPSGPVTTADGRAMAQQMGRVFARVTAQSPDVPVMVIGGDTLLACIEAVPCRSLIPLGEPMPGTVLLRMELSSGSVHLLSRAGGFGSRSALSELIEHLNGGIKP